MAYIILKIKKSTNSFNYIKEIKSLTKSMNKKEFE